MATDTCPGRLVPVEDSPSSRTTARTRRRGATLLALGVVVAVVITVAVWATVGSNGPRVAAADGSSEPRVATTTSTTTTSLVIVHETLDPGVREIATARTGLAQVTARSTPPPGWDERLTPVVVPAPSEAPPRSAQDTERIALPSAEVPIAGRAVVDGGWTFANPGLYTPAQPLVFSVVARQGSWIQVLLPVRPNGTVGWIQSNDLVLSTTTLRVEVSITDRRLHVFDGETVTFEAPISVGRPSTPTPTGEFYVTDLVPSVDPNGPYGPVALALNGYSEAMDSFGSASIAGSPDEVAPVLALHGTNRPDSVGRAASNGCPRLYDADILRLAELVPAGTPVEIWP